MTQDWNTARPRYSSAEALADAACAPVELCRLVFAAATPEVPIFILRGSTLRPSVCYRRQAIVLVGRKHTGASFPQIGRALNRDHSAMLRSFRVAQALHRRDRNFRELCKQLAACLQGC